MTKADAIEELLCMKHFVRAESDADKALDMAISALEENESLAKSLNDAVELIHKLQKKNEWISCSERLPEDNKAVLGYAPKYNNIWAVHMTANGEWMVWMPGVSTRYNEDFNGKIVKWMPLPSQPYKGEEE